MATLDKRQFMLYNKGMKMWKGKRQLYENIIRYKTEHPQATLEEIGAIFGRTRQRVSQILLEYSDNGNKAS